MHDLIDFLQTNASQVLANPVAFAISAIIFGSGGFAVGRYFLTERIANLESRIARRDDEIEALKKRRDKTAAPPLIPVIGTSAIGENDATPLLGKWPDRRGPGTQPPRYGWWGQSSSGIQTASRDIAAGAPERSPLRKSLT